MELARQSQLPFTAGGSLKSNVIALLSIVVMLFLACQEQGSSELLVVSGRIIELSEDVYGIDGTSTVAGKLISISRKVKYRISWLPQEVREHARREPDTEFRYYYRILENGNDQDWSTTIEIITD